MWQAPVSDPFAVLQHVLREGVERHVAARVGQSVRADMGREDVKPRISKETPEDRATAWLGRMLKEDQERNVRQARNERALGMLHEGWSKETVADFLAGDNNAAGVVDVYREQRSGAKHGLRLPVPATDLRVTVRVGETREEAITQLLKLQRDGDIDRILLEQGGRCAYCTKPLNGGFHVDHKMPLSRGGLTITENLCCSCPRCNIRKRAMTDVEFREVGCASNSD